MSITRQLGARVRALRSAKDWSQEDLADHTGLHRTYISGIERGTRNPTLSLLAKLAKALGVKLHDLLKDVG